MSDNGFPEAPLRAALTQFYKDSFGRGPARVRVTLAGDLLVCLFTGAMTAAERTVLSGPDGGRARGRVKRWHREVVEAGRAGLAAAVAGVLGAPVRTVHYDLCTEADECLIAVRLERPGPADPAA